MMNVGHYGMNFGAPGGIVRYVQRLGAAQERMGWTVSYFSSVACPADSPLRSCQTVDGGADLFAAARAAQLDILHLHDPVSLSEQFLPVIRTMHGNHGSCPGGGRFLAHSGAPCHRTFSPTGCFWHRLTEHCGSMRPTRFLNDVRRTRTEISSAESVPTLTVSRFLRDKMEEEGANVSNVQVLLSPAPEQNWPPLPLEAGPPRLLFLGRLVPQKGLDWLLEALTRVGPDLHLDVAGDGSLEKYVVLAQQLGVRDQVTFHGWVDADTASHLIAQSRAVVVPSLWAEPAGLVTLEAAAHGRAVIASRTGGIPEYADPSFAFLVPPGDIDALAGRMQQLTADDALAASMGSRGLHHVQRHHRMAQFIDILTDHYTDAIEAWLRRRASVGVSVSPLPL